MLNKRLRAQMGMIFAMLWMGACYDLRGAKDPNDDPDDTSSSIVDTMGDCIAHFTKGCDEQENQRWYDSCGGAEDLIEECGNGTYCVEEGGDARCVCSEGWYLTGGSCAPCDCDTEEQCCAIKCNPSLAFTACDDGDSHTVFDSCDTGDQCTGTLYTETAHCPAVPPTGQQRCWNDYFSIPCPGDVWDDKCASTFYCGQDAQYDAFEVRSFTVDQTQDPIVIDPFDQQLYWEQAYAPARDFDAARSHCEYLSDTEYAGFDDWRVPDIFELLRIVNYGLGPAGDNHAALFGDAFPIVDQEWDSDSETDLTAADLGYFWSDTPYPGFEQARWAVEFHLGYLSFASTIRNTYNPLTLAPSLQLIRCVKGDRSNLPLPGPERFVTLSPEQTQTVILDLATGFQWQGVDHGSDFIWGDASDVIENAPEEPDALQHCQGLVYGGHSDWLLPNVHQLGTLISYSKGKGPRTDFPGLEAKRYWTSTTSKVSPVTAWVISFHPGEQPRVIEYKNGVVAPKDPGFISNPALSVICMRDPGFGLD